MKARAEFGSKRDHACTSRRGFAIAKSERHSEDVEMLEVVLPANFKTEEVTSVDG